MNDHSLEASDMLRNVTGKNMRKSMSLLTAACLVSAGIATALEAAGMKGTHPTPTPSHLETIIESVTANSITVTTQTLAGNGKTVLDSSSKAYAITKFTEIIINGQRATAADLRPKMKVNVTIGMDRSQAAKINANG
jgi:hypothetical protein